MAEDPTIGENIGDTQFEIIKQWLLKFLLASA